ncbi:MAG: type VII secretion protein EccB [Stackebrandtia sp.]
MRTRKELVEAYLFVTRRIISAMMSTNPDALELPMRRSRYSVLGGILLALLIFAGFWVVGMFVPKGNDNWKEEGSILLDTDTGTAYVYMQETLFPVKNMASAKLIAANSEVNEVESKDLEGAKRGWELGIDGAPPAIPDPESMVGMPWQVCSAPGPYDDTERVSHVLVSGSPADADLGEQALVVTAGEETYLLWNDKKHVVEEDTVLLALGFDPSDAVRVSPVFVSAVDTGPDLAAPKIKKSGDAAGDVGGIEAAYGDFFTAGGQDYVMTTKGLAPVGEVSAALLTDGETPGPAPIGATDVDEVGTTQIEPDGFPQDIPELAEAASESVVCAVAEEDEDVRLAVHTDPPKAIKDPKVFNPVNEYDEVETADHFYIPGGKGAVVREIGAQGAMDGTLYLLTDQGAKYAMPEDAMSKLGFKDVTPTPVPASLVALVPTGPALDPEAVRQQVPFEVK